jgi:hypothetical protein
MDGLEGRRMGSRVDGGLKGWGLRKPEMTKTGPNDASGVVCAFSNFFSLFLFCINTNYYMYVL